MKEQLSIEVTGWGLLYNALKHLLKKFFFLTTEFYNGKQRNLDVLKDL